MHDNGPFRVKLLDCEHNLVHKETHSKHDGLFGDSPFNRNGTIESCYTIVVHPCSYKNKPAVDPIRETQSVLWSRGVGISEIRSQPDESHVGLDDDFYLIQ
jgi:hypothetical protein